jgi:hypothetical protein
VTQSLKLAVSWSSIALFLVLVFPVPAQRKADLNSAPFSAAPYRVGERLTYTVSFSNFVSAAHVVLTVSARGNFFGREAIQLRGHLETTGVVNAALYSMNNDYVSYVDPGTGLPFRTQQTVREAGRATDSSRDFNAAAGLDAIPSKQRSGGFPGTFDFLSALYRLRALPLSEGASYELVVQGEAQEYRAELKVNGRESIKTNVGSFNTIATQVRVKNDSEANGYNIRIYFSDDERHVPVLITAKHKAGEIRTELAGTEFFAPPKSGPTPDPRIANGPTVPPRTTSLDDLPFQVGEQLNYQIFLPNISEVVGTATFQVRGRSRYFDRDGLHLTVEARTTNAAQRLFFADDKISSYVDPKSLLPFRTEMNLIEGPKRLNQILMVSQDYGTATTESGQKIDIPIGTHDLVSFFYAIRTFNLTPTRRNAISLLVNNKPKTLFISSLKRENIQLGSRQIPAIQISLTTDDEESDKFQFRAWVSEDSRRLPLRLVATTELGQVRADLAIVPLVSQ